MSLLSVETITSGYGTMEVLHGVSIDVEEGQIVSVLGPNGAGKTTLLRSIFGVIKPWKGQISYKGKEITGMSPEQVARLGMCYVPQEENIFPSLTVQENLEMGAFIRDDDWQPRLEEVYTFFPDLTDRRNSRAGDLSGGMRQMLAIGRALMLNPQMLLLDEPSTGLAPFLVDQIFEQIKNLNQQGVTVLVVEQNAQALKVSNKSYILEGGEKKAEATSDQIAADQELAKMYLGR